jgi:hypothetical protein
VDGPFAAQLHGGDAQAVQPSAPPANAKLTARPPASFLICSPEPSAMTRPCAITITRSAKSSASSR